MEWCTCTLNRKEFDDFCDGRYDRNQRQSNKDNNSAPLDSSLKSRALPTNSGIGHYKRGVKTTEVPIGWTDEELIQLNNAVKDSSKAIQSKPPSFYVIQVISYIR